MKKLMLFPIFIVILFLSYICYSANLGRDKTYYLSQIDTYMKVYNPPLSLYGYVYFSRDSVFALSENIDFVKVYKPEISSVSFVFNPTERNRLYIVDKFINAQINNIRFCLERISHEDTIFFERVRIANVAFEELKPAFCEIFFEDYLNTVFVTNQNFDSCKEVNPIN